MNKEYGVPGNVTGKNKLNKAGKIKDKSRVKVELNSKISYNGEQSNKTIGKRCSRNTLSSQQTFSNDEMPIKSIWYEEN